LNSVGHWMKIERYFIILFLVLTTILFIPSLTEVEGIEVDVTKLEIKVKTADVKYAGTDDTVYVYLNGRNTST